MLKGAIIGFGKIARTSHIDAYNSELISSKARITAAVETDDANRRKSGNEFPGIKFYSSVNELIEREKPDFIDITCPPKYHYDIMKKAIEKNINIICEKPFTLAPEEAKEIKELLINKNLRLIPCHQYKYSPVWMEFKKFIENKNMRSKPLLQFNIFRTEADPGLKDVGNYWRTRPQKEGGGILIDTGIHYLYLINWMLGLPEKVYCHLTNIKHSDYKCEDTAIINYISKKGIAQVTLTWGADKRHNDARIVCSEGSLAYEKGDKISVNINGMTDYITVPNASDKKHYASLYVNMFDEFLNSIINNESRPEWIEEAFQSVMLLNNCVLSSELDSVII